MRPQKIDVVFLKVSGAALDLRRVIPTGWPRVVGVVPVPSGAGAPKQVGPLFVTQFFSTTDIVVATLESNTFPA